jgi:hypothetical protein
MSISLCERPCRWPLLGARLAIGPVDAKKLHDAKSEDLRRKKRDIPATAPLPA